MKPAGIGSLFRRLFLNLAATKKTNAHPPALLREGWVLLNFTQ
jgi:hypothetical protein